MSAAAPPNPRLLVVDDEPDLRTLYELSLVREGYDVDSAATVEEAWALLTAAGAQRFQLVITDMRLPDGNGLDLLRRMEESGRPEKAIVITAYGSPENAVEALKAGAYDYLTKPVDLRQFRAAVASALGRVAGSGTGRPSTPFDATVRTRTAAAAAAAAADRDAGQHPALVRIAGESAAMQQVRSLIEKVARSMAPVLVHGESGTGKELVARAIHEVSSRGALPFIAVNCGAIPEALLESEFFGYRKGAFTGAQEDRGGFFQAAQGGTLFLDEIGDLPLSMQSKLLRVIQERAVRPIGAVVELPVNVRIVSATHKDLGAEVLAGRFRQDLYYRLNVIRIAVPPLRERLTDLPGISRAVLARIGHDAGYRAGATVGRRRVGAIVCATTFPATCASSKNLLHRALALAGSHTIGRSDLGLPDELPAEVDRVESGFGVGGVEARPHSPTGDVAAATAEPSDLAAHLDAVERAILERALERHRFNRTAAGASLGLSLRQMRYRMARLGVGVATPDTESDRSDPG